MWGRSRKSDAKLSTIYSELFQGFKVVQFLEEGSRRALPRSRRPPVDLELDHADQKEKDDGRWRDGKAYRPAGASAKEANEAIVRQRAQFKKH